MSFETRGNEKRTNAVLYAVALVLISPYLYNLTEKHSSGLINYGYRTDP
jgi:hypothetical protein